MKQGISRKKGMLTSFSPDYVLLCNNMPCRTAAAGFSWIWEPIIPTLNIGTFWLSHVNTPVRKIQKNVKRLKKTKKAEKKQLEREKGVIKKRRLFKTQPFHLLEHNGTEIRKVLDSTCPGCHHHGIHDFGFCCFKFLEPRKDLDRTLRVVV